MLKTLIILAMLLAAGCYEMRESEIQKIADVVASTPITVNLKQEYIHDTTEAGDVEWRWIEMPNGRYIPMHTHIKDKPPEPKPPAATDQEYAKQAIPLLAPAAEGDIGKLIEMYEAGGRSFVTLCWINWLRNAGLEHPWCYCDLNEDKFTNMLDISILSKNWNKDFVRALPLWEN